MLCLVVINPKSMKHPYLIKLKIVIILLFFISSSSFSQTMAKPIGSIGTNEGATTIAIGPSGHYFMGGYSGDKALVIRTTNTGEVIWSRAIDFGSDQDYILELMISSDNFIVGIGMGGALSGPSDYGFAFKMDLDGELIWGKTVSEPSMNDFWADALTETSSGNYQFCGSYLNVKLNNFIFELDNLTGAMLWDTVYVRGSESNTYDETFYDAEWHSSNNAIYYSGRFQKAGSNLTYRPSLTKLNEFGEFQWSKTYLYNDATSGGRFYGMSLVEDGDSIVMGLTCKNNAAPPPFEAGIIKLDLIGDMSWAKLYRSPGNDLRSSSMINLADGYLIAGHIESGDKSLYLMKVDKTGSVLWSKSYGGTGDESVWFVNENSRVVVDGGYAVTVGRTNSYGVSFDLFFVKVDLETGDLADAGCSEDLAIITTNLPNFQADYPMIRLRLPLTITDPGADTEDVIFDNNGNLRDFEADTIVSGDTLIICSDSPLDLFADWDPALDFLWNTGGTSQHEIVSSSGLYKVEVFGDGGCLLVEDSVFVIFDSLLVNLGSDTTLCDDTALLLDAGGGIGSTYLWNDGSTEQTLLAETTGWYSVQVESGLCTGLDSIYFALFDPELNLGNDTLLCYGESILLDALNPGAEYVWSDGETDQTNLITTEGTYWVFVDNGDCSTSDSITIDFSEIFVDLGSDSVLCDGLSLLLDAGIHPGATFEWNDGSTDQMNMVSSSGIYFVRVSDDVCEYSDTISLSFESVISSFEGEPLSGCSPLTVDFTDYSTATLGPIDSWYWSFGDGESSTFPNPMHTYESSGDYTVTLTVSAVNGCSDDSTVINYISVSNNVTATFSYHPAYITNTDLVHFTSFTTNADSWYWDFGDGAFSYDQHPAHFYEIPGDYTITLIATNENGCQDEYVYKIKVVNEEFIYVPNVFTVDGDSYNNTWKAYLYGIDFYDFHLVVYNRWGEILWESYNAEVAWNGTYNGEFVQDGTYVWVIEYGERFTDEKKKFTGHVTILR